MSSKEFYGQLVDYHMHTPLCLHAEGEPREYARRAVELGLSEIGFSEHCPIDPKYDTLRMKEDDLDEYLRRIGMARREFPQLPIRLGIEAEYVEDGVDSLKGFLARADWDYVLGSVHYIGTWGFDWPEAVAKWREIRDLMGQWKLYFELWKKAVQTGLFDSMSHPDLVKKFGFVPQESCDEIFEDALKVAAKQGVCIEINTAGLRKPVKEIYPCSSFLKMANQLKIPITLGSDSHQPGEVGMNFVEAVNLAKECGYQEYARFKGRVRTFHKLPEWE